MRLLTFIRYFALALLLLPLWANALVASSVAAGGNHTCALMTAGVQCWGNNAKGQLGDGTTTQRLTQVVVGLSSGVQALAAGDSHTCALTTAGGVQCWGRNLEGQLGDGTTTQRLTPVAVVGLSSGVQALAADDSHTCALTTAGGVQCWGKNEYGQLGDGTQFTNRLTPVAVVGLSSGVQALVAGQSHTCALTTAGGVQCWGNNDSGALGDGTTTKRLTPVAVLGLSSGVQALSAGGGHTCALTMAGGVQCWGYNWIGQLGDGTTTDRLTPVAVVGLSSGVQALAASTAHTCALTTAGGVQCWGYNYYGQLGDGTGTNRLTPVAVVGLSSGVQALAAGDSHTCALTTAGGVRCWGRNQYGQLGDGTTTQRLTPVAVVSLSSGVQALAAGYLHTCALTTAGGVKCWGYNTQGQLGDGTTTTRLTPVFVVGFKDSDGDGVLDMNDAFPSNAAEWLDTDHDGIGNNADTDDDNDGLPDVMDPLPLQAKFNLNAPFTGSSITENQSAQ